MADVLSLLLQQLFAGLTISAVYALLAVGLALVFGIQNIAHFAHGALFALGAYLTYAFVVQLGVGYASALVLVMAVMAAVGPIIYYLGYHPLGEAHEATLIAALGLLIVIENVIDEAWGSEYLSVPYPFGQEYYKMGGVSMLNQDILTIAGAVVCFAGIYVVLNHTKTGLSMRAMAQNKKAAEYVGISPTRVYVVTFALVTVVAGVAAVLIAPTRPLQPAMGFNPIVKAFIAVVLGGMGSLLGAVIAATILGVTEAFMIGLIAPTFADIASFSLLILILLVKPEGLLGGS
jgi:branched-chain amino acid transport system permease protein